MKKRNFLQTFVVGAVFAFGMTQMVSAEEVFTETVIEEVEEKAAPGVTISNDNSYSGYDHLVSEDGATDEFTIVLDSEPEGTVIISVTPDTDDLTVGAGVDTPLYVGFDSITWNIPTVVTITAVDDLDVEGDEEETLAIEIDGSTTDAEYASLSAQLDTKNVRITDNDTAGVIVTDGNSGDGYEFLVSEDGVTDQVSVRLEAAPKDTVVVEVMPDEEDYDLGSGVNTPVLLTFDATNWNIDQTLTITAIDDAEVEDSFNEDEQLTVTIHSTTVDENYNALANPVSEKEVRIIDNDEAVEDGGDSSEGDESDDSTDDTTDTTDTDTETSGGGSGGSSEEDDTTTDTELNQPTSGSGGGSGKTGSKRRVIEDEDGGVNHFGGIEPSGPYGDIIREALEIKRLLGLLDETGEEDVVTETSAASCPYFTHYMHPDAIEQDQIEILRWQVFLNYFYDKELTLDGFWSAEFDQAVREFQSTNSDEVLAPWGLTDTTGVIYKTTKGFGNFQAGCDEGPIELYEGDVIVDYGNSIL